MNRSVEFRLRDVSPIPQTLRADSQLDAPGHEIEVNLGQLFLHYYFDSYPSGPPNPDPSQFEYLQLVSSSPDFRFHAHVAHASLVKRRSLSTDMGQAFCRLMLADHFGVVHFAHMSEVLGKAAHAAFGGMRVERISPGDVPDYLCAREATALRSVQVALSHARSPKFEGGRWRDTRRCSHPRHWIGCRTRATVHLTLALGGSPYR
jgi:hypothetical protein